MHPSTLRVRRWRKENRTHHRNTEARWRKKNPDKVSAKNKKWYRENKKSELKRNRDYHQKNKKKINARVRLFRHKMTQEEHDALLHKQGNRCAICRNKFRKTPHIDHCHKTNRNRGLLCDDCNLGLGRFKDNQKYLKSAIQYLRSFQ